MDYQFIIGISLSFWGLWMLPAVYKKHLHKVLVQLIHQKRSSKFFPSVGCRKVDSIIADSIRDCTLLLLESGFRRDTVFVFKKWREGLVCFGNGEYEKALDCFLHVDAHILAPVCRLNISALQIELEKYERAVQALADLRSDDWRICYNRGLAFFKVHFYEEAAMWFAKIPSSAMKNSRIPFYYGKTLRKLGDTAKAVENFKMAIALDPGNYELYYYLALCSSALGQKEEALQYYNEALRLCPSDARLWYNKGNILFRLHDYVHAIYSYDKAIKRNPGYTRAWNNKGIALKQTGKIDEAIKCYRRALSYNSRYHNSLLNCALALDKIGQSEKALDYYSRFLQNKSNSI